MKKIIPLFLFSFVFSMVVLFSACDVNPPSSDERQQQEQERILQEGTSTLGMPNIKNFRQKRIVKDIRELCDQMDYVTYLYTFNEHQGCFVYIGQGIGYPIPYSTQYTNPQKIAEKYSQGGFAIIPQADPDGLFYPASCEGTWYMLKDPTSGDVKPIYSEPKLLASPFKLPDYEICPSCLEAHKQAGKQLDKPNQETSTPSHPRPKYQ